MTLRKQTVGIICKMLINANNYNITFTTITQNIDATIPPMIQISISFPTKADHINQNIISILLMLLCTAAYRGRTEVVVYE